MCDYGSRYPLPGETGERFPIRRPAICHRSRRVLSDTVDIKDPHVTKIQNEANVDPEYQEMLQDISAGKKAKYMHETSEVKKIGEN